MARRFLGLELFPRRHLRRRVLIYGSLLLGFWAFLWWTCRCRDDGIRGDPGKDVAALQARLEQSVRYLASTIGKRSFLQHGALEKAAQWLKDSWRQQGLTPRVDGYKGVWKRTFENISVEFGGPRSAPVILVGAHYDSMWESPGADDNASGVAALLEVSRALRTERLPLRVRCVAFVNEEPPFFQTDEMGSRVYARLVAKEGEPIAGMIALESLGCWVDAPGSQRYPPLLSAFYPDTGNFVGVVGDFASRPLVERVTRLLRHSTDVPVQCAATWGRLPGVSWSDHSPFWDIGVKAVMVTDTAPYRNSNYHTGSDTPETLDFGRFARLTAGVIATVRALAGGPGQ